MFQVFEYTFTHNSKEYRVTIKPDESVLEHHNRFDIFLNGVFRTKIEKTAMLGWFEVDYFNKKLTVEQTRAIGNRIDKVRGG